MVATPSDGGFPDRVGGFRVLRRIASGATSDVLLARAEGPHGFERVVVLKLLLRQYREKKAFERMFAVEAAAYARLSHPAIVKLFDFFSDAGQLVMVLEYVDGMPLQSLRAQAPPFDDRAAMFVAWRIFAALAAAHSAKDPQTGEFAPVIHRDVNPANVLVPWDGHVKIADFGIAKVAGVVSEKTQEGLIKGTYGYMAPEQARGEPLTVGADVYAGCLILWELLAGRRAIIRGASSEVEVLRAMAEPSFPSLAALRPDLPLSLLDAVARGLQPDPDRRSIQAEELASVLRLSGNMDLGRQRLVEALAAVRPLPAGNDLETATSGRPLTDPPDPSAEATIPNPVTIRGVAPPLGDVDPVRIRPTPLPPPLSPPRAGTLSSPFRIASSVPPRPLQTAVPVTPATAETSGRTPPPRSVTPVPRSVTPVPRSVTPPPRSVTPVPRSVTPPPRSVTPVPGALSTPPPLPMNRPSAAPPSPGPRPPADQPSVPPPPAVALIALTSPWSPSPSFVPPSFPQPAPTPPPAPVAFTPRPQHVAVARSDRGWIIALAGLVVCAACAAIGLVVWSRTHVAAYTPPVMERPPTRTSAAVPPAAVSTTASPRASVALSVAQPIVTPGESALSAATASVPPPAAPPADSGTVTVTPAYGGHRVWIDKHIVGESPGSFIVRCGWHTVQVGSQGSIRNIQVPCGSDVEVR